MKAVFARSGTRGAALLSALVVASLLGLSAEAKKAPVAGKITFLKGQAECAPSAEGPWKRIKRNNKVMVGDYLRTLDDARLELKYVDQSIIRVAANSTFFIADASADVKKEERSVSATLLAGKAWAKVSKAVGKKNRFEVRTENAVAGVRGTTFRINANEDQSTIIKVYAGAVAVSNAPFFEKKQGAEQTGPIDFKGRKQVATPFKEVSKKEWEQLVSEWMSVRIAADGSMDQATKFAAADDTASEPEWVAWNNERDGAEGE